MHDFMLRQAGGDKPVRLMLRQPGGDARVGVRVNNVTPPPVSPVDYVAKFLSTTPFMVAHRLLGADYPEHTMQGLDAALNAGFKAVEFSTYRTSDGIFIGSHDWTTERTAGVRHEIWNTPWATIQTLDQPGGKFIRIEDMVSRLPDDVIIFIDHKATSSKANNSRDDLASEKALFETLEKLIPNAANRVVWKCFAEASSAERARARGYRVNCMLYPSTMVGADYSRWDILGLEWNASQSDWDVINTTGKPTIAHIIYDKAQALQGLGRGAGGLMVSALAGA